MDLSQNRREMLILGVDPGTIVAGYGLVEVRGNRPSAVAYGVLKMKRGLPVRNRLKGIYEGLSVVMREHRPDVVALEGAFYGKSAKCAIRLGEARGIVLLCAAQFGVPVVEYSPAEVKKSIVGAGRAAKIQVQKMVKLLLLLDELPEPPDAADALALAICHTHRLVLRRLTP